MQKLKTLKKKKKCYQRNFIQKSDKPIEEKLIRTNKMLFLFKSSL